MHTCVTCNYSTDKNLNFDKHNKSQTHLKKVQKATKIEKSNKNTIKKKIEKDININDIENPIDLVEEPIRGLANIPEIRDNENEKEKEKDDINFDDGEFDKALYESLYEKPNFAAIDELVAAINDVDPVKRQYIRELMELPPEMCAEEHLEFGRILIYYYRNNTLHKFLGDLVIYYYNTLHLIPKVKK
jgi:hypothetical protein